jgi:hypothetical protein
VPNGPSHGTEAATAASRLVALLHPSAKPRPPAAGATLRPAKWRHNRRARLAIYYLLVLFIMFVAQWALTNRDAPTPADASVPASQ